MEECIEKSAITLSKDEMNRLNEDLAGKRWISHPVEYKRIVDGRNFGKPVHSRNLL